MKSKVVLTGEAKTDLAEIATWYRTRSIRAAEEFAIASAFMRIETNPTAHVIADAESGARRALLRKYPYRVLYLIDHNQIVVFAIMHRRRNHPAWRERLG